MHAVIKVSNSVFNEEQNGEQGFHLHMIRIFDILHRSERSKNELVFWLHLKVVKKKKKVSYFLFVDS